jgi:hypothetical protein
VLEFQAKKEELVTDELDDSEIHLIQQLQRFEKL